MPHKETRKLIRFGIQGSLGVILPRSWLRFYELKYGDEVNMVSNDKIIISPEKKEEKQ
jgi:antitoxin component of MazEF toxin-antitoxin module